MRVLLQIMLCVFVYGCSSGGGYYEDDGPPRTAPTEVLNTPDAVPRYETPSATGNKTYTALGKTYYPVSSSQGYVATGNASWYGTKYHGNTTSSGEIYDMYKMTAAHPTLPLPSYVRVTNLQNSKSVVVKVNDRGPFLNNRIIDLSYAAAARLGILATGTGQVEVRAVFPATGQQNNASGVTVSSPGTSSSGRYPPGLVSSPIISEGLEETEGEVLSVADVSDRMGNDGSSGQTPSPGSGQSVTQSTRESGDYLQIGVFELPGNANDLMESLKSRGFASASVWTRDGASGQTLYEVSIGPLADWEKQDISSRLKGLGYQPFTVTK